MDRFIVSGETMENLRIAVVEDEPSASDLLYGYLGRYSEEAQVGFQISRYYNATSFFEQFKGNFDIVFMDIEIPLLNGYKTAQKPREKDADAAIIVLARTGGEGADYTQDMRADKKGNPNGYAEYSTAEQNHTSVTKTTPQWRRGCASRRTGYCTPPPTAPRWIRTSPRAA